MQTGKQYQAIKEPRKEAASCPSHCGTMLQAFAQLFVLPSVARIVSWVETLLRFTRYEEMVLQPVGCLARTRTSSWNTFKYPKSKPSFLDWPPFFRLVWSGLSPIWILEAFCKYYPLSDPLQKNTPAPTATHSLHTCQKCGNELNWIEMIECSSTHKIFISRTPTHGFWSSSVEYVEWGSKIFSKSSCQRDCRSVANSHGLRILVESDGLVSISANISTLFDTSHYISLHLQRPICQLLCNWECSHLWGSLDWGPL